MAARLLFLLGACLLACAQTGWEGCEYGALLDPAHNNRPFVCFGKDKKTPHVLKGYTTEQALTLMMDRENNAWTQLSNIANAQNQLIYRMELAARGKAEYGKSPRVHDITQVDISKTADNTEVFVIHLRTEDGREASLWLDGGDMHKSLRVKSVSPY